MPWYGLRRPGRTTVLVCFELRSSEVKASFLGAAQRRFGSVQRLHGDRVPRDCQEAEHIELYELKL